MNFSYSFAPDGTRAQQINRRCLVELANSLDHLLDNAAQELGIRQQAFAPLLDGLRAGRSASPMVYATYYQIAQALLKDELDVARKAFGRLLGLNPWHEEQSFSALDPDRYASHRRYAEMLDESSEGLIGFKPPSPQQVREFSIHYNGGLQLLKTHIPELASEYKSLIRDVYCIAPDPKKKMQMDGGSHYQLWGALFLNAGFHKSDVAVAEVIAHEAGHSFLFGMCNDEPLVFNGDETCFSSPLREDERPMDGIYHATFVLARMHWAMNRLVHSSALPQDKKIQAKEAMQRDEEFFWDGYGTVKKHAELSQTGSGLMLAAHEYMTKQAASSSAVSDGSTSTVSELSAV